MQVKDELRVLVEAEVARAIENFKKLGGSVDDAEKKTKTLGEAIDAVSKKSVLVSAAIGGAGVAAIKFAGENEKLKVSLKNMLGSAEEASAVFEEWRRLGNSPGLSSGEVFELGRAMVNMGHDTAYATKTIQMLGNVAAGTGKSFGTISGAFEHVRALGKLTTRDLNSLQQQGIPVLKQLAKDLNTSEEGVRRLAAEGKIGFSDIEKAFKNMTGPGGQFAGMMDELSGTALEKFSTAAADAKHALASFGELMLPMATELLGSASSILRGITDMDEGTKRFVIGMGGVVAISGPAIMAIKGVSAAMALVAANPYILVIGGAIAGTAALVGLISKQANAYNDLNTQIQKTKTEADRLLSSYADGNTEKTIDAQTTAELIKLYPKLAKEIQTYGLTVGGVTKLIKENTETEIENAALKRIKALREETAAVEYANEAWRQREAEFENALANSRKWGDVFDETDSRVELAMEKLNYDKIANKHMAKAEQLQREINAELAKIGKTLGEGFGIIDIPITLSVDPASIDPPDVPAAAKKKWQEWYGEITKIDPELFKDSGAMAAELYLAEFSRSFEAGKTVFAALGEDFGIVDSLKSQQADIQKALVELFSINPADIDKPFTAIGDQIQPLIEQYKRLGEAAKEAADAQKYDAAYQEYAKTISDLRQKLDDFGKSEAQLAREAAVANGALSSQADQIRGLMNEYRRKEIVAEYERQIKELTLSERELAIATYEATGATKGQLAAFTETLDLRDEAEKAKELERTLKGIKDSLIQLGAGAALSGLKELGKGFGEGRDAAQSFQDALVVMSREILNALPNLFLQAGLQLIAQGQWALGLGFVAAAGSSAFVAGLTEGLTPNAHGNAYNADGVRAFAHGGTFTNQIVSQPTLFKFARGTGLMGEAGPEAIVPLKRMASGNLGVETSGGGGANVTVQIHNYSGAEVRQEEREDGEGNVQIDVIIGEMVNRHITSGKADRALSGRYNLRPAGV
ncbi:MAG: tape measure protein [Treponema sp.]|jgi:tape measure domain-containing protein|nr:tape measure protein [Treponema sp.]